MKRNRKKIWEYLHDEDTDNSYEWVEEIENECIYPTSTSPFENLIHALQLAEELGYYLNYLDGGCVEETWIDSMRSQINRLTGKKGFPEWPEEIQIAYNRGHEQGLLDT